MFQRLILALSATLFLAAPGLASDLTALTDAERSALQLEIRDYLLAEPKLLLEVIEMLEKMQAEEQVADDLMLVSNNADELFDDGYSHIAGNPDGDITIVEFVDYSCGYCRKAFPEVQQLLETDGNIRLILKEYPILGEESILASQFAVSTQVLLGEEAYGKVHDAMMAMRGKASEATLVALADDLGLDGAAIFAGMDDPKVNQVISANHLLAQRMNISGTPTFVIETEMLRGYLPLEGMQAVVKDVRAAKDG